MPLRVLAAVTTTDRLARLAHLALAGRGAAHEVDSAESGGATTYVAPTGGEPLPVALD